ncbi:MAG: hypothetical protein ACI360_08565 [Atopobiaceae bacterium]
MLTHTVRVFAPTQTGTDAMGEPTYSWAPTDHAGVLVRTLTRDGASDADIHAMGEGVQFSLTWPKSDHVTLRGCRVALVDAPWSMDGTDVDGALRVLHDCDPQDPCPTAWDRTIQVGRFDG